MIAVQNFGAGDLLEIGPPGGGATVLMPFTRETVPEVDVEGGWLAHRRHRKACSSDAASRLRTG